MKAKSFLSLFIVILLCLSPFAAFAEDAETVIDDTTEEIIEDKGTVPFYVCKIYTIYELKPYVNKVVDKVTFGSVELPKILKDYGEEINEIELCGLCTDICVISNAMILKASFPETQITVDGSCCAGVSVESHNTALEAMKAVQIEIR